jgi:hypothetical protein
MVLETTSDRRNSNVQKSTARKSTGGQVPRKGNTAPPPGRRELSFS